MKAKIFSNPQVVKEAHGFYSLWVVGQLLEDVMGKYSSFKEGEVHPIKLTADVGKIPEVGKIVEIRLYDYAYDIRFPDDRGYLCIAKT